jgi:hypothetical protein
MQRLPTDPNIPNSDDWPSFRRRFYELWRMIAKAVNVESSNAQPTTQGQEGDFVLNNAKAEVGVATTKYVIQGWDYMGGAWKERRTLTGN